MGTFSRFIAPLVFAGTLISCEKEEIDITIYPYADSLYTTLSNDYHHLQSQKDSLENVVNNQQGEIDEYAIRWNEFDSIVNNHLQECNCNNAQEEQEETGETISAADKAIYHWWVDKGIVDDCPIENFGGNEPITREKFFEIINRFAETYGYSPYEWNRTNTQAPMSYADIYVVVGRMLGLSGENETTDDGNPYRVPYVQALRDVGINPVNQRSIYDNATAFDVLRLLQQVFQYHANQIK